MASTRARPIYSSVHIPTALVKARNVPVAGILLVGSSFFLVVAAVVVMIVWLRTAVRIYICWLVCYTLRFLLEVPSFRLAQLTISVQIQNPGSQVTAFILYDGLFRVVRCVCGQWSEHGVPSQHRIYIYEKRAESVLLFGGMTMR